MDTAPQPRRASVGLLIANHGSPEAPEPPEVRRYLRAFLSDPRVVEAPRWFWLPVLNGIILTQPGPARPRRCIARCGPSAGRRSRCSWTNSARRSNRRWLTTPTAACRWRSRACTAHRRWRTRWPGWRRPASRSCWCCRSTRSTRARPAPPCSTRSVARSSAGRATPRCTSSTTTRGTTATSRHSRGASSRTGPSTAAATDCWSRTTAYRASTSTTETPTSASAAGRRACWPSACRWHRRLSVSRSSRVSGPRSGCSRTRTSCSPSGATAASSRSISSARGSRSTVSRRSRRSRARSRRASPNSAAACATSSASMRRPTTSPPCAGWFTTAPVRGSAARNRRSPTAA